MAGRGLEIHNFTIVLKANSVQIFSQEGAGEKNHKWKRHSADLNLLQNRGNFTCPLVVVCSCGRSVLRMSRLYGCEQFDLYLSQSLGKKKCPEDGLR